MSPDLPEKLLGINIDDPSDRRPTDDEDVEEEELERFVSLTIGEQRLAMAVEDVKAISDPPVTMTRVPRSPDAIDGVVDIRGEITVVIDPRVHFPVQEDPSERQRLLVFDRPTDEQPAAVRVDDVLGVETVPKRNVVDEAGAEGIDDGALEHPLIVGLVRVERQSVPERPTAPERSAQQETANSSPISAGTTESQGPTGPSPLTAARNRTSGEEFELFEEEGVDGEGEWEGQPFGSDDTDALDTVSGRDGDETGSEPETEHVVETLPLLDVDRLLLASGHVE